MEDGADPPGGEVPSVPDPAAPAGGAGASRSSPTTSSAGAPARDGARRLSPAVAAALERIEAGRPLGRADGVALIEAPPDELPAVLEAAAALRDRGKGRTVTYSRKVFLPLTNLCRDDCGYCTFKRDPGQPGARTMELDEVLAVCEAGARLGCKEALLSLGDKPEARFPEHREWLAPPGLPDDDGLRGGGLRARSRRRRGSCPTPTPGS